MNKQDENCQCGGRLTRAFLEDFDFSPYLKRGLRDLL